MSEQPNPNSTLEIGHILALEIVEYTSLSVEDKTQTLGRLQEAIRNNEDLRAPSLKGESIHLATDDSIAFVF